MDKTPSLSKTVSSIPNLLIYLGTYEGRVFTVKFSAKDKKIIDKFSFPASSNALRVIYHNSSFLFVSGTDEIIHMYDLNNKKSNGDLVTYSGSINDIKVCNNWLIVCGDESTIPLWRMSDFNNIINIKGHKGAVISADIHHNGAFLITCGRDKRIIIFDMLTGRKIEKFECECICNKVELFHKSKFLLAVFDLYIYIMDLFKNSTQKEETIIQKCNFNKKVLNAFVVKTKLIIFFSDGEVRMFNLIFENKQYKPFNEENYINCKLETPERESENDLEIKLRFVSISKSQKVKMLTVVYTNNEIYLFDLNKILKMDKLEKEKDNKTLHQINKFYKINFIMKEKITCIDSEFI